MSIKKPACVDKQAVCLLPNHLCPLNGLLQLHQSLLILIPLHKNSSHLHPGKALPLCCGHVSLWIEFIISFKHFTFLKVLMIKTGWAIYQNKSTHVSSTHKTDITYIVLIFIPHFQFGILKLSSNSAKADRKSLLNVSKHTKVKWGLIGNQM